MSYLTAIQGSAIAQGINRAASPEREAERARARAYKAEQDAKLEQIQNTDYSLQTELNNQLLQEKVTQLTESNRQMRLTAVKQRTFDAFDRFSGDNDPRHLNTLIQDLKTNKLPAGPLGDIARIDKLSENDRAELTRLGFDADAILASPEMAATLVRTTGIDGSTMIRSVDELKGGTGYNLYADERELQNQKTRAEIMALMHRATASGMSTKDEREAARIVESNYPELEQGSDEYVQAFNAEYNKIINRNRQTAAGKEEDVVDQLVTGLNSRAQEKYGADFLDLDMADPKVRVQFERDIEKIERMGNLGLTEGEKKKLSQIKQLIAIGNPASSLSDKETGLIDRFSNDVQKFVKDKVQGVEATSAYAAYRNILRNALYGSVLTEGEMKAFRDQFGDLGQQTGPILVQFKTALTQLRGDMQALLDTNNSYVMHYRMGKSREELQEIIDSLDERIEFIAGTGEQFVIPASVVKPVQQAAQTVEQAVQGQPQPAQTEVLNEQIMQQLDAIANEVSQ